MDISGCFVNSVVICDFFLLKWFPMLWFVCCFNCFACWRRFFVFLLLLDYWLFVAMFVVYFNLILYLLWLIVLFLWFFSIEVFVYDLWFVYWLFELCVCLRLCLGVGVWCYYFILWCFAVLIVLLDWWDLGVWWCFNLIVVCVLITLWFGFLVD